MRKIRVFSLSAFVITLLVCVLIKEPCSGQNDAGQTQQNQVAPGVPQPFAGPPCNSACQCPSAQARGRNGRTCNINPLFTSIAPTEKNGVIVFYGGYLYKYDKDLNLVKRVVIGG